MADTQVANIVNEILRVETVEEAFSGFLVHKPEEENERLSMYQKKLSAIMTTSSAEVQEAAIRQYITLTAVLTNRYKMKQLLGILENLVNTNILQARMLCDCILTSEKLIYKNSDFWIECFCLIRRIIGGVDYKGVREIMKGCREKAQTLPKLAKLLTTFVESFKPCAQMVSIIGHSQMLPVVEFSGYSDHLVNPWRLDPATLRFALKGNLPYDEDLLRPQISLLRHVLQQPYSRDMMCSMLGLQKQHKQRCIALEDQLVELMILPMEKCEQENEEDEMSSTHWCWLHLSSQVIYLILIGFASFPNIVMGLHNKLIGHDLKKGRDHLMWVLLQFISGSIQRNPLANFLPIIKLYELLYPEKEPLPVPDCARAHCTHQMAVVCIWMHLLKKAESELKTMTLPQNLKVQYE
ncbi:jg6980 [Pararge aegeria aegeria]|uniref:Mediator of RNA polymerase II transcription subunit 23 n=1 Tax=Pararge aegeria aegeria TaxID=348720 RepID=A0A8S4S365_9NEOP|nr:jg6980 [Pararge aegeria aegeria]